jgi:hypothetical protein
LAAFSGDQQKEQIACQQCALALKPKIIVLENCRAIAVWPANTNSSEFGYSQASHLGGFTPVQDSQQFILLPVGRIYSHSRFFCKYPSK